MDSFASQGNTVVLSFMTYEKPVCTESSDELVFSIGSLGTMRLAGGKIPVIEEIPISDARLKTAWEHEIYRILVTASKPEIAIHIS